jgi:carbon-monoxide dehydrogenase medium subunit
VCGSLAHADPAAELPMLALALDAELVITGGPGQRVVPASDFFVTYLTTALDPTEMLTEARFPALGPRTGWAFQELARRAGDFAIAAAAVVLETRDGAISRARIALGAVADRPVRAAEAEAVLLGQRLDARLFERAATLAVAPLDPPSDVHGSGAYRRHLAGVLLRRALTEASERLTTAAGR